MFTASRFTKPFGRVYRRHSNDNEHQPHQNPSFVLSGSEAILVSSLSSSARPVVLANSGSCFISSFSSAFMKKFIVAVSLLLVGAGVAVAKGNGGGAVVVGTAVGVGVSARNAANANTSLQESDCAACHAEIFPFKQPDTCVLRSGVDCWKRGKVNESISIMTRTGAKENRVYSFEVRYRPIRYFLPAAEGVRNPHFVLEEQD